MKAEILSIWFGSLLVIIIIVFSISDFKEQLIQLVIILSLAQSWTIWAFTPKKKVQ